MALITFERVMQHIGDVTPEQIGRCHRVTGPDNKDFYLVENERGDMFEGQILEYAVRYSEERGYTCTCPSGAAGFYNVHHPSGVCKHCRWATAAILEERGYIAEMAANDEQRCEVEESQQTPTWYNPANESSYHTGTRAHLLITGGLEADDATYTRVMLAQPHQYTEEEIKRDQELYQSKPFNIIDEG